VIKALSYKVEGCGFEIGLGELYFSISLILPAALCPGIYLSSNINEHQKQKNNVSWEYSSGWLVGLTTSPPFVNQMSR
jgi:hypothetical protein